MTALLIYYFLFVSFAILITLILYKFFDMFLDWFSAMNKHNNLKR